MTTSLITGVANTLHQRYGVPAEMTNEIITSIVVGTLDRYQAAGDNDIGRLKELLAAEATSMAVLHSHGDEEEIEYLALKYLVAHGEATEAAIAHYQFQQVMRSGDGPAELREKLMNIYGEQGMDEDEAAGKANRSVNYGVPAVALVEPVLDALGVNRNTVWQRSSMLTHIVPAARNIMGNPTNEQLCYQVASHQWQDTVNEMLQVMPEPRELPEVPYHASAMERQRVLCEFFDGIADPVERDLNLVYHTYGSNLTYNEVEAIKRRRQAEELRFELRESGEKVLLQLTGSFELSSDSCMRELGKWRQAFAKIGIILADKE